MWMDEVILSHVGKEQEKSEGPQLTLIAVIMLCCFYLDYLVLQFIKRESKHRC